MRISELGVPLPVYSSLLDIRRGMWIYATGTIYWILGVDICLGYSIIDTRCRGMPQVQYNGYQGWIYAWGRV